MSSLELVSRVDRRTSQCQCPSDFIEEMSWSSVWSLDHEKQVFKLHSPTDFQQRTRLVHDTLRSGHESGIGVIVFGVHMIAYTKIEDGLEYWVPRWSKTKMIYPGKLDNTVGGSLTSGEKTIDCMVRESAEEASLPKATLVRVFNPAVLCHTKCR